MKLVIDTNIILSSLIRDSVTRRILLFPSWKFITPSLTLQEIEKHLDMVVKKSGLTTNELGIVYNNIKMKI
ncbi:MAG: PIN domain-containing protein, partial [Candidatus Hodarchaeales archaeon]